MLVAVVTSSAEHSFNSLRSQVSNYPNTVFTVYKSMHYVAHCSVFLGSLFRLHDVRRTRNSDAGHEGLQRFNGLYS